MSTHNIGFYEDLTKIIFFKLSSNVPHLFFWSHLHRTKLLDCRYRFSFYAKEDVMLQLPWLNRTELNININVI